MTQDNPERLTVPDPREGFGITITKVFPAVGPDVPTVTSPNGAKQSALPYRFDLMDARALFQLAAILHTGAEKYGVDNWRGLTVKDHLGHAFCRLMMAVATQDAAGITKEDTNG